MAAFGHLAAALAVVLVFAFAGRFAARRLRQPEVIGEILAGLLLGPAAVWLFGATRFHQLLPPSVLSSLKTLAEAGLVLFLVGLAHKLRLGSALPEAGTTGRVAAGSFVPALLAGGALAGWVLLTGDPVVRGTAPVAAFVLLLAVSLAITAVPVLARIMADRGMAETATGRLALSSAIVIDTAGWLLLTVALGLGAGSMLGFLRSMGVLAAGALAALVIRRALRTGLARGLCSRAPWLTAVLIGAVAIAVALSMEHLGLTAILGAVLVGLAIPAEDSAPWAATVTIVSSAGRALVPVFFVVTGVTVLTTAFAAASWQLVLVTLVLGMAGKLAGGYFGARWAEQSRWTALRIGSLMNTRGLTELIVLQVGLQSGILTGPLFLALVVMTLVSTALTGPLLLLIDRAEARHKPVPSPAGVGSAPR